MTTLTIDERKNLAAEKRLKSRNHIKLDKKAYIIGFVIGGVVGGYLNLK